MVLAMGRKEQEHQKLKRAALTLSQDIGQMIKKMRIARFGRDTHPLCIGGGSMGAMGAFAPKLQKSWGHCPHRFETY